MDKNIAAILRNDTRTIGVNFFMDKGGVVGPDAREYTYITDIVVAVGDLVVVETGGAFKVVKVSRVDDDLNIEPNSDIEYKWVVSKVEIGKYEENLERNRVLTDTLGKAYQSQMRRSFADTLLGSLPEGARAKIAGLLG